MFRVADVQLRKKIMIQINHYYYEIYNIWEGLILARFTKGLPEARASRAAVVGFHG